MRGIGLEPRTAWSCELGGDGRMKRAGLRLAAAFFFAGAFFSRRAARRGLFFAAAFAPVLFLFAAGLRAGAFFFAAGFRAEGFLAGGLRAGSILDRGRLSRRASFFAAAFAPVLSLRGGLPAGGPLAVGFRAGLFAVPSWPAPFEGGTGFPCGWDSLVGREILLWKNRLWQATIRTFARLCK